ncbi:hypothetical protein ZOSMA_6G02190 [Zostera marina]|uniref:Uncharacterized protein n=1 Tax=Zostera marina TaxID=29655 RepID=A0A0K9NTA5_ZOSMR|nr:hypothetical protein ZOSMA_6G02190 [Zostera marina]
MVGYLAFREALFGNTKISAMTYAFIEAVEKEPGATYGALLFGMCAAIREADSVLISSLIKRVFRNVGNGL